MMKGFQIKLVLILIINLPRSLINLINFDNQFIFHNKYMPIMLVNKLNIYNIIDKLNLKIL